MSITLKKINTETALIEVKGTAPLIVHAWSPKAKRMMLDNMQGVKKPRELREPETDYESSKYLLTDGSGDGFPIMGFKAATVKGGARAFGKAVRMTELRQSLTFLADGVDNSGTQLVRLRASEPIMREDVVRVNMGGTDLRYRAEYRDWSALLRIQFAPSAIDLASVVALVDAGGANGVGEWRPERSGSYGTYEVVGEDLQ